MTAAIIRSAMAIAFLSVQAAQSSTAMNECDRAAHRAAKEWNVPVDILLAITRVETGRTREGQFAGWPWTVNRGGAGQFFETRQQAILHAENALAAGDTNIDIGCFQINLHWHSKAFGSLDDMFDPTTNALYAASFLMKLHDETGDWEEAVGAFHSRRPDDAGVYLSKVARHLQGASKDDPNPYVTPRDRVSSSRRDALFSGSGGRLGSLVAVDEQQDTTPLFQ